MLTAGTRLGAYELAAPLGSGGMGAVYRARDTRLGREVAVKILPPELADPVSLARFEQEARHVAALNHPNVVSLFDIGSDKRHRVSRDRARGRATLRRCALADAHGD
jgi:serine/threonine protein kinase